MADDLKEDPKNPEDDLKQASGRYESFSTSQHRHLTHLHSSVQTLIDSTVNCLKNSTGSDFRSASLTYREAGCTRLSGNWKKPQEGSQEAKVVPCHKQKAAAIETQEDEKNKVRQTDFGTGSIRQHGV